MRSSGVLLVLLANILAVSAVVSWKDSISRKTTDVLRFRARQQKYGKISRHSAVTQPSNDAMEVPYNMNQSITDGPAPKFVYDPSTRPLFVELPLDHFSGNGNSEKIKSRYYVQDLFYKPGGPVIFFDGGESGIDKSAMALMSGDGPMLTAQRFNGLVIFFEHRYYGQSLPKKRISPEASPEELTDYFKYLTIEQALEDVVVFARDFTYDKDGEILQLNSDMVPWVFMGASYPGTRGAFLAKRNPGLFKATLASSAPVQLKQAYWEYYATVERALAINNKNCSADIHSIANWMSEVWESKKTGLVDQMLEDIFAEEWTNPAKELQGSENEERLWDLRKDMMSAALTSGIASDFQHRAMEGNAGLFCEAMETTYCSEGSPDGVFAKGSLEEGVKAFAEGVKAVYSTLGNGGPPPPMLDELTWNWQFCSEFGAFQISNTSRTGNLIPSFINLTSEIEKCVDTFGLSEKITWNGPDVDLFNQKYGGWDIEVSNTLFTDGEFDPWRALSVNSDFAPSPLKATEEIVKCGQSLPAGTQFKYVIRNGTHGSDLGPGILEDVLHAQDLWGNALEVWLNCNGTSVPNSYGNSTSQIGYPPVPISNNALTSKTPSLAALFIMVFIFTAF